MVPAGALANAGAAAIRDALVAPDGGTLVAETLPPAAWNTLPAAADDRLSRGIRAAFDPAGILNPGILGGGA